MYYFVFQEYKKLFDGAGTNPGEKTLEDKFFEYEVRIQCGYEALYYIELYVCLTLSPPLITSHIDAFGKYQVTAMGIPGTGRKF